MAKVLTETNTILYWLDEDFDVAVCDRLFAETSALLNPDTLYNELILFAPKTKLSDLTKKEFHAIMMAMKLHYEAKGIIRAKSAILSSKGLYQTMTLLWVAYCDLDTSIETEYRVFERLREATKWAEVDHEPAKLFLSRKLAEAQAL